MLSFLDLTETLIDKVFAKLTQRFVIPYTFSFNFFTWWAHLITLINFVWFQCIQWDLTFKLLRSCWWTSFGLFGLFNLFGKWLIEVNRRFIFVIRYLDLSVIHITQLDFEGLFHNSYFRQPLVGTFKYWFNRLSQPQLKS